MKNFFTLLLLFSSFFGFSQTVETFTISGTFTVPAGVSTITVELWGAGGGGGNGSGRREGGGGGGYSFGNVSVTPGEIINYTVGVGAVNTTGGTTTFKTISATGGAGGIGQTSSGGAGGVGTGGTINNTGGQGGGVISGNAGGGGGGGSAMNSANGNPGGISTSTTGGTGGTGQGNGGNGANQNPSGPAQNGIIPGGGGGGRSSANSNAGAGARGEIIITYNATLPVSLTKFNAFFQNRQVNLNWSMANASNFDRFEVEHSNNGIDFTTLQSISTSNTMDYATTDANPSKGINYYRLKMMDLDGSFSYSEVKTVKVASETVWSVSPTKSSSLLTATVNENEESTIQLFNTNGQMVYNTIQNGNPKVEIPIGNLTSGIYIVRISVSGSVVYSERIIKE